MTSRLYSVLVMFFFMTAVPLYAEEILTWEQCIGETKLAHPDLYSALALLQQAEANKRITEGSLFPQLSLNLSSQGNGSSGQGIGSSVATSYSLSAQQLLYDGHKTSEQIASNTEAVKAAQYNYSIVSANVRFALRSAFAQLLLAQDLVDLTNEIAARRLRNVRLISLYYKAGKEDIGSLHQAEADYGQADFAVAQAKRSLVLAQTTLSSALGRDSQKPFRVQGTFKARDMVIEKPNLVSLAKNNPLFLQLDAQSNGARYNLEVAKSAFSPQLYLTSSVGRTSPDRLPTDAVNWSAGVTVSVPIYQGGIGRETVVKAEAVLNQLNAQEKSGYLQILNTLEQSWKNFQDARQLVVVQKKQLDAAVDRSNIANVEYSDGIMTFNEWVIIENSLVSAKLNYLNAEAALLTAEAQWIQSKGEGLDNDEKE